VTTAAGSEVPVSEGSTLIETAMATPLDISESVPTDVDSIAFEQPPTQSETSESIAGAGISGIEDSLGATEAIPSDLPESFTNAADSADVEVRHVKADQVVDVATAGQVVRPEATTVEEEEEIGENLSTSVTTAAGSTATALRPLTSNEPVNIDENAVSDARAPATSLGATSEVSQSLEEAESTFQSLNVGESSRHVREETEEEEPMLMPPTDVTPVGDAAGVDTT
jgi:hypothetical protein